MLYPRNLLLPALLSLLPAFPGRAVAAIPPVLAGEQVLVTGKFGRKCAATVASIPSPGFARLQFERAGCGDAAQVYELKKLQHLIFVPATRELSPGDSVTLKGYFGADCAGHVRGVSRGGYVSVDLDSLLCADAQALYRTRDLTKFTFVNEGAGLTVGQKVSVPGIHEDDQCRGEITRLTSNGLAQIHFEKLTCADAGKLYPLDALSTVKPAASPKRVTGELIFQRMMREIASQKKAALR